VNAKKKLASRKAAKSCQKKNLCVHLLLIIMSNVESQNVTRREAEEEIRGNSWLKYWFVVLDSLSGEAMRPFDPFDKLRIFDWLRIYHHGPGFL